MATKRWTAFRAGLPERRAERRQPDGRARGRVGEGLVEPGHEDGVACVLGDPHAVQERQRGEVEVARAPAEQRRVEREDDGRAAARLRATDERADQVVVGAPVELEPARRPGPDGVHRGGRRLHRHARLARKHERDAECGGRPRHGEVRLRVRHLQHADGRQQQRRRQVEAEQRSREVARVGAAQDAGDDAMSVECRAVGRHRPLLARAAGEVGPRLIGNRRARGLRQSPRVGGDDGPLAGDAGNEHGALAAWAGGLERRIGHGGAGQGPANVVPTRWSRCRRRRGASPGRRARAGGSPQRLAR